MKPYGIKEIRIIKIKIELKPLSKLKSLGIKKYVFDFSRPLGLFIKDLHVLGRVCVLFSYFFIIPILTRNDFTMIFPLAIAGHGMGRPHWAKFWAPLGSNGAQFSPMGPNKIIIGPHCEGIGPQWDHDGLQWNRDGPQWNCIGPQRKILGLNKNPLSPNEIVLNSKNIMLG
jgi:hypothetical protein